MKSINDVGNFSLNLDFNTGIKLLVMILLISLIAAAFVLVVLDKCSKYPSRKHKRLAANLWVEESQSEVDYQKQISGE